MQGDVWYVQVHLEQYMDFPVWPPLSDFMSLVPIVAFTFLTVLSFLYFLAFGGPLHQTPGSVNARFSRLWMIQHSWQGDMHRTAVELHKRHGKLVRTGLNEVSVADPAAIKKTYAPGTKFPKSSWYGVFPGPQEIRNSKNGVNGN